MSCSPHDLRDYFFEELGRDERRQVEAHLEACTRCREELEQLRGTQHVLLRLKDEEIPRRIAFVSDKVFEPSWASRLWAMLPRLVLVPGLLLLMFFAGAAWSSGRSEARVVQAMQSMEARHEAEMRDVRDAYEIVAKQMNMMYRQSAEMRPAAFRQ